MLKNDESTGARSAHTRQVKQWVRELLVDGDAVTVMVGELECAEPGCPPRETVIALLREGGRSEQRKLHRALLEVTRSDVERLLATGEGDGEPRGGAGGASGAREEAGRFERDGDSEG
jgi:hypothetical protein